AEVLAGRLVASTCFRIFFSISFLAPLCTLFLLSVFVCLLVASEPPSETAYARTVLEYQRLSFETDSAYALDAMAQWTEIRRNLLLASATWAVAVGKAGKRRGKDKRRSESQTAEAANLWKDVDSY